MQAIIQKNKSENNRVDKELENLATIEITLKKDTSIIEPVFFLSGDSNIKNANYITVPDFGRSYFIKNITSVRQGLWEASCKVDVLTSFKDAIRSNEAIIQNQERRFNLMIDDGTFKVYQDPIVTTIEFPNGFSEKNFILAIAGH